MRANVGEVLDDASIYRVIFWLMIRFIALFLLCLPLAHAQQPEALSAYVAGQYQTSVRLSEAGGSASDYALAARAVLAEEIFVAGVEPSQAALRRAQALATRALELEPRHIEGRMQLAIALSLQTRPMSTRAARRSGYAGRAKELADSVLADDPGNSYANGFVAVWHVEVLRRGGRLGAMIMGASVSAGREHYATAISTAPDDGSLHWQWARILAATNPNKYRAEIDQALAASIAANTDDALEGALQARAKLLQDEIAGTNNTSDIKAFAAALI